MDLILIHGALASKHQMHSLKLELDSFLRVFIYDLPGHGDRAHETTDFSMDIFQADLKEYIYRNNIIKPSVFGFSMGGYIAMRYAIKFTGQVDKIITLGTKYLWNNEVAVLETKKLVPELMLNKVPAYAEELNKTHKGEWIKVVEKTSRMMRGMGITAPITTENLKELNNDCLIMQGDQDKMVTTSETIAVFKQLAKGSLCILPSTPHAIEKADHKLLAFVIRKYLLN